MRTLVEWFVKHSLSFSTCRLKCARRHNSKESRSTIDFGTITTATASENGIDKPQRCRCIYEVIHSITEDAIHKWANCHGRIWARAYTQHLKYLGKRCQVNLTMKNDFRRRRRRHRDVMVTKNIRRFKWSVRLYLPFLMLICSENLNNSFLGAVCTSFLRFCDCVGHCNLDQSSPARYAMGYRGRDMVFCLFGLKHRVRLTVTNLEDLPRIFEIGESRQILFGSWI